MLSMKSACGPVSTPSAITGVWSHLAICTTALMMAPPRPVMPPLKKRMSSLMKSKGRSFSTLSEE